MDSNSENQPEKPKSGLFLILFIIAIAAIAAFFIWEKTSQDKKTATQQIIPEITNSIVDNSPLEATNELVGQIFFKGEPPAEKPMVMDVDCLGIQPKPPTSRFYRVAKGGAMADVLVYVKKGLEDKKPVYPSSGFSRFLMKSCLFEPYVFGLRTNQVVEFLNQGNFNMGKISHDIRILGASGSTTNFSLAHDARMQQQFPFADFITVSCDLHPWEFAYGAIFEHPCFAVSNAKGTFSFQLPRGHYTIAAYHRKLGEITQEVEIKDPKKWINFIFNLPPGSANSKNIKSSPASSEFWLLEE